MAAKKKKKTAKKSAKAVKAKRTPAKKTKAKKTAKRPAKKAAKKASPKKKVVKAAKKAPAKKTAKKAVKKQQIVGEGDYAATRKFDKDQASFVERNKAAIPAMAKDAEKALDGPQGDELRDAEAAAAGRSRDTF